MHNALQHLVSDIWNSFVFLHQKHGFDPTVLLFLGIIPTLHVKFFAVPQQVPNSTEFLSINEMFCSGHF